MPIDLILVLPGHIDRSRLCNALAQVLSIFPPVTGRFLPPLPAWLGQPKLSVDEPVPVPIFWVQSKPAQSYSREKWRDYVHRVDTSTIRRGGKVPLLKITVTPEGPKTVVGISFAHLLGDATVFYQFLQAWSNMYTSESRPRQPPALERVTFRPVDVAGPIDARAITRRVAGESRRLALSRLEKIIAYSPYIVYLVMRSLKYARFHLPADAAETLVRKVRQSSLSSRNCSTQDAVKGYLFKALNQYVYAAQPITRIRTMVNGRTLRGLPETYFGNCLTVSKTIILDPSLTASAVAVNVRQSLEQLSPDMFSVGDRWLQDIQTVNGLLDVAPAFDSDCLYVNDWTKNPLEQVDFGFPPALFWQPLEVESFPVKNWCMIYRSAPSEHVGSKSRFSYDIQIAVSRAKARAFCVGVQADIDDDFGDYFG